MIYLYGLYVDDKIHYIGLTNNYKKREGEHKRTKPPHTFKILEEYNNIEEATEQEKIYIERFNTFYDLDCWNKSLGGDYIGSFGYERKGLGCGVKKGNIPWNKGLKAENDERVKLNTKRNVETRKKKGYKAWNKGIPNPQAAINGKKGANKQSKKVMGRRLATREDGTRYWVYPPFIPNS